MEFVCELFAPNGFAACTIPLRVPGLNHEPFNDSMELEVVVVSVLAMGDKVLARLWTLVGI
jgi:hypothetical protein